MATPPYGYIVTRGSYMHHFVVVLVADDFVIAAVVNPDAVVTGTCSNHLFILSCHFVILLLSYLFAVDSSRCPLPNAAAPLDLAPIHYPATRGASGAGVVPSSGTNSGNPAAVVNPDNPAVVVTTQSPTQPPSTAGPGSRQLCTEQQIGALATAATSSSSLLATPTCVSATSWPRLNRLYCPTLR